MLGIGVETTTAAEDAISRGRLVEFYVTDDSKRVALQTKIGSAFHKAHSSGMFQVTASSLFLSPAMLHFVSDFISCCCVCVLLLSLLFSLVFAAALPVKLRPVIPILCSVFFCAPSPNRSHTGGGKQLGLFSSFSFSFLPHLPAAVLLILIAETGSSRPFPCVHRRISCSSSFRDDSS